MRIGILGGSFDPIHIGHVALAKTAMAELKLDRFDFMPTRNNPWKDVKNAPDDDRRAMILAATKGLEGMDVEDYELHRPAEEKNYTIDTMRALVAMHPEDTYYFLMGMDQACAFHQWKNAEELSQIVQLVAFNRGGYPEDDDNLDKYGFIKISNPPVTASSTEIKNGNLSMLDQNVLRYISAHGLYLDTMIKPRMKDKRWRHSCSVAQLCADFAEANGLDRTQGYIAGILHDVAKDLDMDEAEKLMHTYYPDHADSPKPIWHQWTGAYVAEHEFLVEDKDVLKAIEDHTTAATDITRLGKCLYCADKLDPLRGYDSSRQIAVCKEDIDEGFRNALADFYNFSKKKGRHIDPVFFDIYNIFVKGHEQTHG